MSRPTGEQVAAVMDAIVAPPDQQPNSLLVGFQRFELEQTIRRVWPHTDHQVQKDT